ncbi:MAG: hypothetical protein ACJZ40_02345 [Candidatus Poseidoniaceae archaeon]
MSNRASTHCSVCDQRKPISPCALCKSLTKKSTKKEWDYEVPHLLQNEVVAALGGPHQNVKQRWKLLLASFEHSADIEWARLDPLLDPVVELPASEAHLLEIASHIEHGLKLSNDERMTLHKGFLMHDGLHFSFQDHKLSMNGRQLPCLVPSVSLLRVLSSKSKRTGWNLSQLMILMGCSDTAGTNLKRPPEPRGENHRAFRLRYRRYMRRFQHPSRQAAEHLFTWLGWMSEEHIPPPPNYILHPLAAWARDIKNRLDGGNHLLENITEAFANHPAGLEELSHYPWLQRWESYTGTRQENAPSAFPLRTIGGKLKLRVRTKSGTNRNTNVQETPKAWALLFSMALSPLTSHAGETLFCIQKNWTSVADAPLKIPKPVKRSIEFLNEVMQGGGERVYVHGKHILVVGRLGHFYEVIAGRGAHGAPFVIRMIDSLQPRRTTPICIHAGTFHTTLPLGDTMASVVLTLLDDVKGASRMESLLDILAHHPPLGFPGLLKDEHVDMLDTTSLETLKGLLRSRRRGMTAPYWLQEFRDQFEGDGPGLNGPPRDLYYQYMERRNRRYQHRDYVPVDGHIGTATTLVLHAAAAKQQVPLKAMAKLWTQSLAEAEEREPEPRGPPAEGAFNMRFFGRQDWMFLRNRGQAEEDAPIGDIRNGERRFCEVFPRIWEAMLLQPIGSTMLMGGNDGVDVSFEDCMLRATVRSAEERSLIRRFAREAGYAEDGRRDGRVVFRRRDHPRQWARRNLSETLNRAQQRFGFRGAPPWWWHYIEAERAPDEAPMFRWELGEDLRDDNQRNLAGDFQP